MHERTDDAPIELAEPTRVRWVIFALACAVSWLLYLHRYSWGVIKPYFHAEHPEFTDADLGWLDSAFLASYSLGQAPFGLVGDLVGGRGILSGIILVWSVAMGAVAWTAGFWRLFGIRASFGLAQAGAYPILNKMTRNWFPSASRTSAQGIITALGRIGAACSSFVLATLLMGLFQLSWQTSLWIMAVPGISLSICFWIYVRDTPAQHPAVNDAERQLLDEGPSTLATATPSALHLDGRTIFSLGMLLVYSFASTFQDQLFVFWIPKYLAEGHHLSAAAMGLVAPLPLIGGAVGGIFGGALNDLLIRAWSNRKWARRAVGCTGKSLAAVLVYFSFQAGDGLTAMTILLAARFFSDWSLPTQWGTITDMGGRAAGTLFGLVNTVGAAGGFAAGPILGLLKQHYDWKGLFLGVVVMCLVAACAWLFIDCTRRIVAD